MRALRILVMVLICAGMANINPAEAQFKKLRNKGKDKIEKKAEQKKREKERKLDAKVDRELDKAVEGAEDSAQDAAGNLFERKAQEAMANAMGEPEEPFDLGPNASGNASAPFVMYRSVTRMHIPGMDELPDMFKHLFTVNEVHYLHDGRHRTDSRGNSNIADARARRLVNIMHASEEYSVRTFDELANMIEAMNNGSEESEQVDDSDMPNTSNMKASVTETGRSMMVNNVRGDQRIMVIEGDYSGESNGEEFEGKFFFVTDAWISSQVAGHKTITDINMEIAREMGAAFAGANNSFAGIFAMMQSDPEMSNQMNDALAELRKMGGGLPVMSDTYIVQAPKDATLDLDKVLQGVLGDFSQEGPVTEQKTMMKVASVIGDLSTDPFNLGLLDAPGNYSLIEYQDPFQSGMPSGMPGGMPGQ
ncbi:MAG: hypothetical protein HKN43_17165 [Rhodothermales bacterium]|nr:hypothetical protein [Rhodothermales bacterium]